MTGNRLSLQAAIFATTVLILIQVALAQGEKGTAERPNVVLILLDDLGYSDFGCFGGEIETPNIDQLGLSGIRFTQFYNSARCCPSRASLMTGLYPHQTGIGSFTGSDQSKNKGRGYTGKLNDECVTVAQLLKQAGYQTYCVGKWHLGNENRNLPTRRGFDQFYGFTKGHSQDQWRADRYRRLPKSAESDLLEPKAEFYATDMFNRYALKFLDDANRKDDPFFLFLSHSSPHFPIQAPKETVDKYFQRYLAGWDQLRKERTARQRRLGLSTKAWHATERSMVPVDKVAAEFSGKQNPEWAALDKERQKDLARRMAIFAAMVDHVDRGVGSLVAKLRAQGKLENTLILITSDNGACYEWSPIGFDGPSRRQVHKLHRDDELKKMGQPGTYHAVGSGWSCLSNTPLRKYKHFTHEGGICSPLIVHWPGEFNQPGKVVREPAHVMDVMPTLLEVAGAKYPGSIDGQKIIPLEGQSLFANLNENRNIRPRQLGFEHQGAKAYRIGKWKIVWSKREPEKVEWELYDLSSDRTETRNLASKYPERVAEMVKQYEAWAKRVYVSK